jgi:DNA repair photolyase
VSISLPIHGRGAADNPANRFEPLHLEIDPDAIDPDDQAGSPPPRTIYLRDTSRSIIATNDSPDVGFSFSINPYRGCEHGCIYCYARPTHEYLGFSAGLDFESRILIKTDSAALLRRELSSPRWKPEVIGFSGVTDCYQPAERTLHLTRQCLEVFVEFGNPCSIISKSGLVRRDIDVLQKLAKIGAVSVMLSISTLDAELSRIMEPRASSPQRRLETIGLLADAGIPVGVMVAPVVPGLTDREIPAVLAAAKAAGARHAGYEMLRLPGAVAGLFEQWLRQQRPLHAEKVLGLIRGMRGGQLNDSRFGTRMRGEGRMAEQIKSLFELSRRRTGITGRFPLLSTAHFRRPSEAPGLFD